MQEQSVAIHPRPQLRRARCIDPGGAWGFAYDDTGRGFHECWQERADIYTRMIQVPFPPESSASDYNPGMLVLLGSRDERLHMGHRLGATHTLNVRHNDPQAFVDSLTEGRGADLVFEGGNRPSWVEQALNFARRGGAVVLEGIAGVNARLNVESDIFALKHLAVFGIFGANAAAWIYAVHMFSARLLHLAPLISHYFPSGEYQAALNTLVSRPAGTLKVLLVHEGGQM